MTPSIDADGASTKIKRRSGPPVAQRPRTEFPMRGRSRVWAQRRFVGSYARRVRRAAAPSINMPMAIKLTVVGSGTVVIGSTEESLPEPGAPAVS